MARGSSCFDGGSAGEIQTTPSAARWLGRLLVEQWTREQEKHGHGGHDGDIGHDDWRDRNQQDDDGDPESARPFPRRARLFDSDGAVATATVALCQLGHASILLPSARRNERRAHLPWLGVNRPQINCPRPLFTFGGRVVLRADTAIRGPFRDFHVEGNIRVPRRVTASAT